MGSGRSFGRMVVDFVLNPKPLKFEGFGWVAGRGRAWGLGFRV